jgi:hypothetical protein
MCLNVSTGSFASQFLLFLIKPSCRISNANEAVFSFWRCGSFKDNPAPDFLQAVRCQATQLWLEVRHRRPAGRRDWNGSFDGERNFRLLNPSLETEKGL